MSVWVQRLSPAVLHVAVRERGDPPRESYVVPAENRQGAWKELDGTVLREGPVEVDLSGPEGRAVFRADPGARFYGMGQQQEGTFEYHGRQLLLKHTNITIAMPVLLTNRGYGVYWDNPGSTQADFTPKERFSLQNVDGGPVDFYILRGETLKEQLCAYWALTGPAVLLPRYAFGFWQSKMRYTSQEELLSVARRYREKGYPLDIIVVDFYHWTGMGNFDFDPRDWPDPQGMLEELRRLHVECMVSIWPYVQEGSRNFPVLEQAGGFVHDNGGNALHLTIFNGDLAGLYDPFRAPVRRLYWDLAKGYYDLGASIGWLDSCEPDDGMNLADFSAVGANTADGPLLPRINAYALLHCRGFFEGQRQDFPRRRVLTLARSAFCGCQKYGVAVWSGDIGYDFDALRRQISAGLSAAMSGLPFWTTDVGGFQGGDPKDEGYRELYVRWFQYSAFCPLLRVHGSRGAQSFDDLVYGISRGENEVWSFGERAETILVKYLRQRYRLLPYLYTAAWQTCTEGLPMMRPLVLEYGEDCREIEDQFMLGPSLLVCPVLEAGADSRRVYLPAGAHWYELETGRRREGGRWVTVDAPLNVIPVFVKSGAVLPVYEDIPHYALDQTKEITLLVYPGNSGESLLYCDDGVSWEYEQGAGCLHHLIWDDEAGKLTVTRQGDVHFSQQLHSVQVVG